MLFVHKVPTKIDSGIFVLSKMRHLYDTNRLKMVYFVYVHSTISFRTVCHYMAQPAQNLQSIPRLQKYAIRMIINISEISVKEKCIGIILCAKIGGG